MSTYTSCHRLISTLATAAQMALDQVRTDLQAKTDNPATPYEVHQKLDKNEELLTIELRQLDIALNALLEAEEANATLR